jgi:Protein of unknown function DUF262/Protein of unknown function (DUF1524)
MTRTRPYSTKQTNWKTLLSEQTIIPMNQRNYDWTFNEIMKVMNDLKQMFVSKYLLFMGTVIIYNNEKTFEVWEGQQRTLTIILVLVSIAKICDNIKSKTISSFKQSIMNMLSIDIASLSEPEYTEGINEFIRLYPDNYEDLHIPQMYCINPNDNKALCEIFNTYNPVHSYFIYSESSSSENTNDDDDDDDNESILYTPQYTCKKCNVSICSTCDKKYRYKELEKHIKECYADTPEYNITNCPHYENSNLYAAYEYIYETLSSFPEIKSIDKIKQFYNFILNDIDITVLECNVLEYVAILFDLMNNRGKSVEPIDVIKNLVISKLPTEERTQIYNKWCNTKSITHPCYKDYGMRIMDIAVQLYNNCVTRMTDETRQSLFENVTHTDQQVTLKNANLYFNIVDTLLSIMTQIEQDKYGKLILTHKKCIHPWDAFMFFILPVLYKMRITKDNTKFKDIIEKVVLFYYRNIGTKNRNANNLCYSNHFIELSDKYVKCKIPTDEMYNGFLKILTDNKNDNIKHDLNTLDNYVITNQNKYWNSMKVQIKYLLCLLAIKTSPDAYDCDPENYDLEHVYPESKKKDLSIPNTINLLGNFTLLEKCNSDCGHKGNRSLQDKSFAEKIIQYKDSTCNITRDIYEQYKNNNNAQHFTVENIRERTKQLLLKLNDKTNY